MPQDWIKIYLEIADMGIQISRAKAENDEFRAWMWSVRRDAKIGELKVTAGNYTHWSGMPDKPK